MTIIDPATDPVYRVRRAMEVLLSQRMTPERQDVIDAGFAALDTLCAPKVPQPLDEYENAVVQYLKRTHRPTLADVLAIWGWRHAVEPECVPLPHLAECLWRLCERCQLLGYSFATPGAFGGMGVLIDAAPTREWALLLDAGTRGPLDDPTRTYWWRVISVLCSRLLMAKVSDLPGYDHDATAGPFGHAGNPSQP